MARFWKFTSFVGSVGFVLLLSAFFVGHHAYHTYPVPNTTGNDVFLSRSVIATLVTSDTSMYYALAGAACVVWQVVMTVMGMLVGFFRAPDVR